MESFHFLFTAVRSLDFVIDQNFEIYAIFAIAFPILMSSMEVYLLIRSTRIPTRSAVLAGHRVAFFDVIGACLPLKSFCAMTLEIAARQRNTRATIITRR